MNKVVMVVGNISCPKRQRHSFPIIPPSFRLALPIHQSYLGPPPRRPDPRLLLPLPHPLPRRRRRRSGNRLGLLDDVLVLVRRMESVTGVIHGIQSA